MGKRKRPQQRPNANQPRTAEREQQLAQMLVSNEKLQKQNERLQKQVALLQAEVEELKRAGKRPAAPFARRHWVEHPKRPGRKAGQGGFTRRAKPGQQDVNETKTAPLPYCPECHGKLRVQREHEQFMIDLPPVQPIITRFVT